MTEPVAGEHSTALAIPISEQTARVPVARAAFASKMSLRVREFAVDAAWRVRELGPRRGGALIAALVAIVAAVFVVWPMREQARALQQQLARLPAVRDVSRSAGTAGVAKSMELPRVEQLPLIVAALLSNAQAADLELATGTYRLVPAKAGGLSRYEIALPVTGTYPSIRKFVEASLAATPALALDGMALQRPDVASPKAEVDVRFVVFVTEGN